MRILLLLKVFRLRSGKLDAHRLWRSTAVIGNKPPDQKNFLPKRVKLSFDDPEIAYKNKSTGELIRAYTVFTLCSFSFLVDRQYKVKYSNVHII